MQASYLLRCLMTCVTSEDMSYCLDAMCHWGWSHSADAFIQSDLQHNYYGDNLSGRTLSILFKGTLGHSHPMWDLNIQPCNFQPSSLLNCTISPHSNYINSFLTSTQQMPKLSVPTGQFAFTRLSLYQYLLNLPSQLPTLSAQSRHSSQVNWCKVWAI